MLPRAFIAVLALVVAGALVWAITAGSDSPSTSQRVATSLEKKAVRVEKRLAKNPDDEKLLLATMHAWITAGSSWFENFNPAEQPIPSTVPADYRAGMRAWDRYLSQTGGEASVDNAEYAGAAFFSLVEIGSTDPSEAEANAAGAARALRIACRHERNLYNLSNLATYEYFNGEIAVGNEAAKQAAGDTSEAGVKSSEVIGQLSEFRERGEKFVARVKRGKEELQESGDEELETPIKGYGAPAGINGYEPGTGHG
jgi:hypothetical protein